MKLLKNDTEEKELQRIIAVAAGTSSMALGFPGGRAEWGMGSSYLMVKLHLKEFRGDRSIVAF